MIPIPQKDLIRMQGGGEKLLNDLIITVMHEFHYDIDTIKKMPVPTFFEILRKLKEDQDEQERQMRWSKQSLR